MTLLRTAGWTAALLLSTGLAAAWHSRAPRTPRAAPAPRPSVDPVTLDTELAWMDAAFGAVEANLERGKVTSVGSAALSRRLMRQHLFLPLGVELDEARNDWADRSRDLLEDPRFTEVLFQETVWARRLAAVLHELAGDPGLGREFVELSTLSPSKVYGLCGTGRTRHPDALFGEDVVLNTRRSEHAERAGDLAAALHQLDRARPHDERWLPDPNPLHDLRHGRLLVLHGFTAQGVAMLQRTADLYPDAPEGTRAADELRALGLYEPPTTTRLLSYERDGRTTRLVGVAIGLHALPDSYDVLMDRLAKDGGSGPALHGLGVLPEARAREHAEESLWHDRSTSRRALLALHRAGCMTREHALAFVNQMERREPPRRGQLPHEPWLRDDAVLRQVLGDGPDVLLPPTAHVSALAEPWRHWLGDP